jgi:hypothetical protein
MPVWMYAAQRVGALGYWLRTPWVAWWRPRAASAGFGSAVPCPVRVWYRPTAICRAAVLVIGQRVPMTF